MRARSNPGYHGVLLACSFYRSHSEFALEVASRRPLLRVFSLTFIYFYEYLCNFKPRESELNNELRVTFLFHIHRLCVCLCSSTLLVE